VDDLTSAEIPARRPELGFPRIRIDARVVIGEGDDAARVDAVDWAIGEAGRSRFS